MSDIHEKIANLLELANNNPSEEEAAQAASMARKLMLKYNIDERSLGRRSSVDYNAGGAVDRDYWRLLMSGIANIIPVRPILFGNKNFKWAGTSVNAQIADQMLTFWAQQVEHLYKQHLPPGMSKSDRAKYRTDFKRNCAVTITQRARDLRKQQALDKGEGTELVVIQSALEKDVEEFLATKNISRGRGMKLRSDSLGAAHGRQAGNTVQLNRGVQ
jgi:hypothetical protein